MHVRTRGCTHAARVAQSVLKDRAVGLVLLLIALGAFAYYSLWTLVLVRIGRRHARRVCGWTPDAGIGR